MSAQVTRFWDDLLSLMAATKHHREDLVEEIAIEDGVAGVYFVIGVGTGRVKIGRASNIRQRLSGLRCGSPVPLKLVGVMRTKLQVYSTPACAEGYAKLQGQAVALESEMHTRFARQRVDRTEWFTLDDDLLAFIRGIR